ncbi:MAG: two-component sensor histidine kinase, partial [Betaproteobacteria bacterium]|nr:two-component sensor histidine kinase [Betaproteobacteria bacterium]
RLFEPLFRLDTARTRTGQHGSGLGLSIVRAIVQAHQGKVQAKPSPLGGLTIEVALPLQPQTTERKQASA